MAHTYADLAAFKNYVVDTGSTVLNAANDVPMLGMLEAASRRVDEFCDRSRFGSGFGPRIGTNKYDSAYNHLLRLHDDLLSISAFTFLNATNDSTTITPVADTDYFLRGVDGAYLAPYREILLHGFGASTAATFGWGFRTITVTGTWGYQSDVLLSSTTVASGLSSSASATTFTTSATPTIAIGQTLRIGSEDLYLTGLTTTTATVERGANGTTAAVHADNSTISVHRYPRQIVNATLQVALRRWKMRDSGLTGDFGGGQIPGTVQRDSEMALLRATVGHLRLPSAF